MNRLIRASLICFTFAFLVRTSAQGSHWKKPDETAPPNGIDSELPLIAPVATPLEVLTLGCHGRSPCKAIHRFAAGHDAGGSLLEIFVLDLWDGNSERDGWGGASRPFESLRSMMDCRSGNDVEYWLFARRKNKINKHQLIHVGCDGSGFGQLGEEEISFTDNEFSYRSHGGVGYNQGNMTASGSLSPAVILQESEDSGPCNIYQTDWDWQKFSGSGGRDPDGCGDGNGGSSWSLIPRVHLPVEFTTARWKTISPGDCASRESFTLKTDSQPMDQSLRVVLADSGDLFIEVHDARLIDNSKRWIFSDHVELWLGGEPLESGNDAQETQVNDLRQWGISAVTGKVFPGYGKPPPLPAEVVRMASPSGSRIVRMKIKLPKKFTSITVLYSDTDDGKRQTRMLSTSLLIFADYGSLGGIRNIAVKDATCEIQGDRLSPVVHRKEPEDPNQPLIGEPAHE